MVLLELWGIALAWALLIAKGWREYASTLLPLPVLAAAFVVEQEFESLNGLLIAYSANIAGLSLLVWIGGRIHSRRMTELIDAS